MDYLSNFFQETGFYQFVQGDNWKMLVMIAIACVLLYLALVKKFEPLLLTTIAFGMLLTNLPGAEMYHEVIFAGGHVNWTLFGGGEVTQEMVNAVADGPVKDAMQGMVGQTVSAGLLDYLYLGVKLVSTRVLYSSASEP